MASGGGKRGKGWEERRLGEGEGIRTAGYVLLVGEDEEEGFFHFAVEDYAVEFLAGFVDAGAVVGVDDED